MPSPSHIRNFCIIAHIDHGKTTLSDRLLETTHTLQRREMQEQVLDSMDLERERGITIKCHPVTMRYIDEKRLEWILNLIDTPGHVDFSYEVSRSLAACEGALLLVDAAQGIEAQTVANAQLAMQQGLIVIPVLNKIDLPGARPEEVLRQLEDILAIPREEALRASAKTGLGIAEIFVAIIERIPAPKGSDYPQTRCLIFDSVFNTYQGVICYVRIFSGELRAGDEVLMMGTQQHTVVKEVGIFSPQMQKTDVLRSGQVGYVVSNFKRVADVKIGDTVTLYRDPAPEMLRGYKDVRPMVFSGLYPLDTSQYGKLQAALERLQLNDAALVFQSESSTALGFGFRCGFLGLLHMEIVQERLRREYDLDVISTYPGVVYRVHLTDGSQKEIDNPLLLPDASSIASIQEPTLTATLHISNDAIGDILSLVSEKRGICGRTETVDTQRVMLVCQLPLSEILVDFNDRLKSITRGYGSMDYELGDYVAADLVRLDILVNGESIEPFASMVHRDKAASRGRELCEKLKELLPKQLFKIAIQAAVGANVVARETLGALRKDVTAKCYGGDITRKRKLLEKQKEGKKRMKQIGKVSIPQDAFLKILKSSH
ncbi:MAG: translation elongation factor 4 [Puniceicoccales bacterium]|jgi:GTP-binding protein LepA|nr:translation elongation factor 4 [Puniceicoccales bacterium]